MLSKLRSTKNNHRAVQKIFDLTGRVAVITGGAGLLGVKHAEAVAAFGGIPVLLDINEKKVSLLAKNIAVQYGVSALGIRADITRSADIEGAVAKVLKRFGRVDILINNASNNPKVEVFKGKRRPMTRLENFPLEFWDRDLSVGLTGAFLCSQIVGREMAKQKRGVIINIASDLSVIAPDQRIYRQSDLPVDQQFVKPVTYSVIKTGLIGLTRYMATYWAEQNIRVNALSPGGVFDGQSELFVYELTQLIPMGRMAKRDEYQGTIVFLCSDASSYMTGQNLVMDGGRSVW